MLDGAMIMWFSLAVPSLVFVAVDIWRGTSEAKVLKWAFVILTVFTGPIGAFFYVLGCREPLPGTHESYVAARWRQVLGSTMHCAAGDGLGIIAGAAIGGSLTLGYWSDFALEYILGFGLGWAFFQAFAMRSMAGGSYAASLKKTFLPEFLSMNVLMAGMHLVSKYGMMRVPGAMDLTQPSFWFLMSMALLAGFAFAYPMNWWLVANHLKHGMLTVGGPQADDMKEMAGMKGKAGMTGMTAHAAAPKAMESGPSAASIAGMTLLSLAVLFAALAITQATM